MRLGLYVLLAVVVVIGGLFLLRRECVMESKVLSGEVVLPAPNKDDSFPLAKAIQLRRSVRAYKDEALSLENVSQLLWAAQGITSADWLRAAPSAGALYPMELYVVIGKVDQLDAGIYKYDCRSHTLSSVNGGDKRSELSSAAMGQDSVQDGMMSIVICGVHDRTRAKYGDRAERYVYMEAGHVAQNIYLMGVAMGLGTVVVGAFDDDMVRKVVGAQTNEYPLYIMPLGKK